MMDTQTGCIRHVGGDADSAVHTLWTTDVDDARVRDRTLDDRGLRVQT